MQINKTRILATVAALVSCSIASAQTLRIGTASGKQGQTVSLPVTLTGSTSLTAVLVRVQYNSAALEMPAVTSGPLLSKSHALDSYAPAAGTVRARTGGVQTRSCGGGEATQTVPWPAGAGRAQARADRRFRPAD